MNDISSKFYFLPIVEWWGGGATLILAFNIVELFYFILLCGDQFLCINAIFSVAMKFYGLACAYNENDWVSMTCLG